MYVHKLIITLCLWDAHNHIKLYVKYMFFFQESIFILFYPSIPANKKVIYIYLYYNQYMH